MTLHFRFANSADGPIFTEILKDLYVHYYGPGARDPEAVARYVEETVMTAGTACEILLAESDGRTLGFATFSVNHPGPTLGGQLTLKDLYVHSAARSQGIGPKILQELARIALARNCSRVDWTAETTNPRALAFYDRLGARREEEKVYFRLDGDALEAVAAKGKAEP
ncbi:MAG: GNAT family N-acetyltransferase [Pseudomonadota bacterium]